MTGTDLAEGGGTADEVSLEDLDTDRFLSGDGRRIDFVELFVFGFTLGALTLTEYLVRIQQAILGYYEAATQFLVSLGLDVVTAPLTVGGRGLRDLFESSFGFAAADLVEFEILAFVVAVLLVVAWFVAVERLWVAVRGWLDG